ncbi:MAG: SAF domain-containing protein [Acidimicrobiales bacterium]
MPLGGRSLGGRRRALPGGRAVIGGFLIAVAAVIVFAATLSSAGSPGQRWVVASRPLSAGTVLAPGDLGTAAMRLPGPTASHAFHQDGLLVGRTLAAPLEPGELVQGSLLVPADQQPKLRPVDLQVDPVTLVGLGPGQPVDVLETSGNSSAATVTVIARGATILGVAQPGSSLLEPSSSAEVTVGVSTLAEVEAVVQAAHSGTVTLVTAERSDGVGPGPGGAGK